MDTMESIYTFGKKNNLVGFLSSPDKTTGMEQLPLVLILNAGVVHRAGPFRMNTELARTLAKSGYPVFRFDLAGIGDSEKVVADARHYKQRNLDDVGEAIQFLSEKLGHENIVVTGLCTGADLSHRALVKYPQVCNAILMDGYGYPTGRFYVKRYLPVSLDLKRLFSASFRILKKLFPSSSEKLSTQGVDTYIWELPPKEQYIEEMQQIHQDAKKQLYIYSGGVKEYYNYQQQFYEGFNQYSFVDDVTVEYLEATDHTYILLEHRARLFKIVLDWLATHVKAVGK